MTDNVPLIALLGILISLDFNTSHTCLLPKSTQGANLAA